MIHANRIVTVGEQESIIDRPIILYRGDREVEIEFTLVGNEFMFSEEGNVIKSVNASHGQLVLNTPSGEHMFSELAECHEGKVVFVVTKEMIDEFVEMGFYSFQIRLYDSAEMKSRVTIPPVMNGFDIRNPIAAEDEVNVVDQGLVDYSRIFKDQSNEELPTFDWTGAYNKTEWEHHDVITENKLNKIEDALYSINAIGKESDLIMRNTLDQVKKDADKYVKERIAEVEADIEEFERNLNTDVQKFKIDTNAAMTAHKNDVEDIVIDKRHFMSVADFGAKGDGKTDDTEAIQAAFDYMNSHISAIDSITKVSFYTVFFPKGVYNISSPINIYNRVRIVGERSIIRSSAEWCIDHPDGDHGGTIGWQTEISHMIFLGKNGVRLNTRQGDATTKANLDYGHIYFHDCIFNNAQGYAFVGDVQSCLLKFDMCLINAPMDVLCDDFVMDTCWCNWTGGYNVQEFIVFKGSKMYIDKCMFIPYSGNADASKEHAWVGIYDYTVPSSHQGMSFAVIDRCNFGAEASGHNIVNCKTSSRTSDSSQTSGVRILNSALALTQYAVRCFELPDTINIEGCRGVGGLNLVGLCDNFDNTKLDILWNNLNGPIRRMNINWRCENNSLRLIEASNKIRSYFCNDLLPIVSIRNFQRNYMNGAKRR